MRFTVSSVMNTVVSNGMKDTSLCQNASAVTCHVLTHKKQRIDGDTEFSQIDDDNLACAVSGPG